MNFSSIVAPIDGIIIIASNTSHIIRPSNLRIIVTTHNRSGSIIKNIITGGTIPITIVPSTYSPRIITSFYKTTFCIARVNTTTAISCNSTYDCYNTRRLHFRINQPKTFYITITHTSEQSSKSIILVVFYI